MNDAQLARLTDCFIKVFPDVKRDDIPSVTQASLAAWDSIAHVTLVTLIGEEFNLELDFEDFDEATSFAAFRDLVSARLADA